MAIALDTKGPEIRTGTLATPEVEYKQDAVFTLTTDDARRNDGDAETLYCDYKQLCQSVRLGLAYYLGFLAVVSVGLGVLNLLPLPVLDGGHLMYYLWEGVTGRSVSDVWMERLQRGGVVVLMALMSVALFNDVARLAG